MWRASSWKLLRLMLLTWFSIAYGGCHISPAIEVYRDQGKASCQKGKASCVVPVHVQHQSLALYLFQRLYAWEAGLGLGVATALQPKTHREGHGHHDLVLKHAGSLFKGPFQCHGFKSTEVQVRQVVRNVQPSTAG